MATTAAETATDAAKKKTTAKPARYSRQVDRQRLLDQLSEQNRHLDRQQLRATLEAIAASGTIPHLLLHGPGGSGKTSLAKELLARLYGSSATRTSRSPVIIRTKPAATSSTHASISSRTISASRSTGASRITSASPPALGKQHHPSNSDDHNDDDNDDEDDDDDDDDAKSSPSTTTKQRAAPPVSASHLAVVTSQVHAELCGTALKTRGLALIKAAIKQLVRTRSLSLSLSTTSVAVPFRVLLITSAEDLPHGVQHALRRLIEINANTCRFIFVCRDPSQVVPAILSRCLCLRVAAPPVDEVALALKSWTDAALTNQPSESGTTTEPEQHKTTTRNGLSDAALDKIANTSRCSFTRARALLKQCTLKQHTGKQRTASKNLTLKLEWETFASDIARSIFEPPHTSAKLATVRLALSTLLLNYLRAPVVLRTIMDELLTLASASISRPDSLIREIIAAAACFDSRLQSGTHQLMHLVGFAARVMVNVAAAHVIEAKYKAALAKQKAAT